MFANPGSRAGRKRTPSGLIVPGSAYLGAVPMVDPSHPISTALNNNVPRSYRYGFFEQDTFLYGVGSSQKTTTSVSGGATITTVTGFSKHYGNERLSTTSVNDFAFLVANITPAIDWGLGDGYAQVTWWFHTDTTLSNATDRYQILSGISDQQTVGGTASNRISTIYRDNVNGGALQTNIVVSGSTQSTIGGYTLIAASTWYRVRYLIDVARSILYVFLKPEGKPETLECVYSGTLPLNVRMIPFLSQFRSAAGVSQTRNVDADAWEFWTAYATEI